MKKGSIELQGGWLFDLFFLSIIILIFVGVNAKIQNDDFYILKYQIRDYAFAHDAASISPKINFVYNKEKEMFLEERNCEITGKLKEKDLLNERYYCSRKDSKLQLIY